MKHDIYHRKDPTKTTIIAVNARFFAFVPLIGCELGAVVLGGALVAAVGETVAVNVGAGLMVDPSSVAAML